MPDQALFETLNTKRPNDIFEEQGLNGKLNGSRVPYFKWWPF